MQYTKDEQCVIRTHGGAAWQAEVITLGLEQLCLPTLPTHLTVTIEASYSLKLLSNKAVLSCLPCVTWWGIADWPWEVVAREGLFHHPCPEYLPWEQMQPLDCGSIYEHCKLGFCLFLSLFCYYFLKPVKYIQMNNIHCHHLKLKCPFAGSCAESMAIFWGPVGPL